jgi:hypothetical protein
MAVKLHRCGFEWNKMGVHPCWRVEKALKDAGVEYELAPEPWPGERPRMVEHTGQKRFPAIEFEDGSWYRDDSKAMAAAIRAGKLNELRGKTPNTQPGA